MSEYTDALRAHLDELLRDVAVGRFDVAEMKRIDDLLFQARHVLEDYLSPTGQDSLRRPV